MAKVLLRADTVTIETLDGPANGGYPRSRVTVEHFGDRYEMEGTLGKIRHVPPPMRKVPLRERLRRARREFGRKRERVSG